MISFPFGQIIFLKKDQLISIIHWIKFLTLKKINPPLISQEKNSQKVKELVQPHSEQERFVITHRFPFKSNFFPFGNRPDNFINAR